MVLGNNEADFYAKRGAKLNVAEFGRGNAMRQRREVVQGVLQFIDVFSSKARREDEWPDVTPWPRRAGIRRGQCRRTLAKLPHRTAMLFRYVDPDRPLASVGGHSLMFTGP